MPALMFTKDNPFELYKIIKKSKTPAAAKPGQLAPRDIIVPAGPTPFTPGPVISEFAALGIKAGVEGGKVAVKQDALVVKEGQPIEAKLASMLQRLGIEPMEIGLDLSCVYEKGVIYPKSVLDVDEVKFMADLIGAATESLNVAVDIGFITADNAEVFIAKAYREAKALEEEAKIAPEATPTAPAPENPTQ
jgi:large subunit ribosomal protein L10